MTDIDINEDDPLWSTTKVAETLGITGETVREWISSGKLPAVKVNRQWRVKRSEVVKVATAAHG